MASGNFRSHATEGVLPHNNPARDVIVGQLRDALQICQHFKSDPASTLPPVKRCVWYLEKVFHSLDRARSLAKYADPTRQVQPVFTNDGSFFTDRAQPSNVFKGLVTYLSGLCKKDGAGLAYTTKFLNSTLPCIINQVLLVDKFALEVPNDIRSSNNLALDSKDFAVFFIYVRRFDAAVALASMFLCLVGPFNGTSGSFPRADYREFFGYLHSDAQVAKLKMILYYFDSVSCNIAKPLDGNLAFMRVVGKNLPKDLDQWKRDINCKALCKVEILEGGGVEERIGQVIEVDFANAYIGGGTLTAGRVQEEIRFFTAPELQVSMLFNSRMEDNEVIGISGFQTFSKYTGYSNSLKFGGPADQCDKAQVNKNGDLNSKLTAIDATAYSGAGTNQYTEPGFLRDLNKAYLGFCQFDNEQTMYNRPIATGNWGCGAFGGDAQLKALLQWIAASHAHCPKIVYYTFGHKDLSAGKFQAIVDGFGSYPADELLDIIRAYFEDRRMGYIRSTHTIFDYVIDIMKEY